MNDIHELVGAYCTDALDPQERADFEAHLADCADCRDEVADFREVLGDLSDAHAVRPPESLEEAVLAHVLAPGSAAVAPGAAPQPTPARSAESVAPPKPPPRRTPRGAVPRRGWRQRRLESCCSPAGSASAASSHRP